MNAVQRVRAAYARIAAADRPEVWITLRPQEQVAVEAERSDALAGPLAGRLMAVKDNIDVAGLPTTAGCPEFAYVPAADSPAVARLRAAGALIVGKTNLDQFATGLVGTRSPYGAVRDARRPAYVSGGSSSGSAVAIALGFADFALGTDTAGSGRVPAAFQGLAAIKPTRGLVSTGGVVPACRSLDCVTVMARDAGLAQRTLWTMAGPSRGDTRAAALERSWPIDAPLAAPPSPRLGVADEAQLAVLSDDARRAFAAATARLTELGASLSTVDITPLLEAGALLYGSGLVAERHAAVGSFIASHPGAVDPTVGAIISGAAQVTAGELIGDHERLDELRLAVTPLFAGVDAIVLPTVVRQPTIAEVAADPIAVNTELGRFTNFANLLDLCAVALPAGEADGGQFGISLLGRAFSDLLLGDLMTRWTVGEPRPAPYPGEPTGISLLVIGAHRTGQPLNHQLTSRGARPLGVVHTRPEYRMYALATEPPKPGLVRVETAGASIEGELWDMPSGHLGSFLAALPAPMALGRVSLADGRDVVGFQCEPAALDGAPDISGYGSWLRYLEVVPDDGLPSEARRA